LNRSGFTVGSIETIPASAEALLRSRKSNMPSCHLTNLYIG